MVLTLAVFLCLFPEQGRVLLSLLSALITICRFLLWGQQPPGLSSLPGPLFS